MSEYTYLTDDIVQGFNGVGGERLLEVIEIPDQSTLQREDVLSQLFTEVLLVYEDDKISLDDLVQFLFNGIKNDTIARIFCQVLDVFPATKKIHELLQLVTRKDSIKQNTIAMYISPDLLKESNIVPAQSMTKSLNTKKRDEFYTQKKFNLLHEETEGFSKFVVEIYHIFKYNETDFQVDYAIQIIEKLIGHYSLDPNKCLDLLLEIYASSFVSRTDFAFKLLRKSRWWPKVEGDISSLQSLNVGGNEAASKIIGLKLMKYPKDKDIPETFKILIGCLIKEGFISFGSVWKYLRPNDEDMSELEKLYKKRLDNEVAKAGANALALAAPLLDDDEVEEPKKNTRKPEKVVNEDEEFENALKFNFKYQILRVVLGNGLYWPSIFILTKYPFLAYVEDEISELINRMFDFMISPLYDSIRPFNDQELNELQRSKRAAFSRPQNQVVYEDYACTELLSFKPTIKSYSQKKFVYFYDAWSAKLPHIADVNALFVHSKELLKFNGVNIAKSIELFIKICDIGNWDLRKNNPTDERKLEWFHYFRNYIFPAMCVTEENSIVIDKAFSILSLFPLEDRFSVYGELYQVLSKNNPRVKMAYNKAEKSTKDVLKRLSKENVRPMMRRLAKISFSNPLPCLLTILQQIESYDNLNSLVVETARYFNSYGWDTLTAAILIRLTVSGKSSVQENGMFERQWIQSLASFIGKICQRYPNAIDIRTILSFLLKSFHSGEKMGLIVLKEILSSMGGMQSMTNLTLHQIDMINCGSTLQKLVYRTIDDVRFTRVKSGRVLFKTLLDLNAINELLILLCHTKEQYNLSEEQNHLKILASKNDDLDAVSSLFTTMVTFFGTVEEIENELLPISELCTKYNVPIEVAFEIWRPILSKRLLQDNVHGLNTVKTSLPDILSKEVLESISPTLFVSFWSLSLHDINYSSELYDSEISKLESNTRSQKDAIAINSRNKEIPRATIEKNKADLKMDEEFVKKLPIDKEEHSKHSEEINNRLLQEAEQWFTKEEDNSQSLITFLQYCVLPRAIHSSFDALFVARFLFKLQELKTKNFSVILLLDKLINNKLLFGTLFSSTPTEAENLGLFFAEVLGKLYSYTHESKFNSDFKDLNCVDQDGDLLTFERFRSIVYTYHCSILQDVGDALTVDDYMCRRNAITLLKNLVGVYPNVEDHCEQVAKLIENIILTEKREDLKLSSNALIGHLKSRSKEWVHLWDFIEMSEESKEEHMKKRKAIEDQVALEKRKKREAEMAKESEEKRKRIKATINYDSEQKSVPSSRPGSRKVDSRGRYDNYSNYNQKAKEPTEQVTKANGEKEIKKIETKEESKDADTNDSKKDMTENDAESIKKEVDTKSKEGNEKKEITNDKKAVGKGESDNKTQDSKSVDSKKAESQKSEKTSDIKAKLSQARKEFAASNKNAETPDTTSGDRSRSRTPLPDQKEYSKYNRTPVPTAPGRPSRGSHNTYEKSRAPLPPPPPPPPPPPQSGPRGRNDYDRNSRGRPPYNSRDGRYGKDSRDTRDVRDRESRDNREGRDGYCEGYNRSEGYRNAPKSYDKRKNDGYGSNSRGYDKRQKY